MAPTGANQASPPNGVGARTRSTGNAQGPLSKEQLMASGQAEVTSLHKARLFLTSKGYTTEERPPSPHDFAAMLFALSQEGNLKRMAEGIRAVAWVLESEVSKSLGKTIGNAIFEVVEPATRNLSGQVSTLEKVLDKLSGVSERLEKLEKEPAMVRGAAGGTQGGVFGTPAVSGSYAEALKARLPMSHDTTVTREKIKARQVIVDVDDEDREGIHALSEAELVAKANVTLELIEGESAEQRPDGSKFIGARKMRNGGILYEMDSMEAAQWLRHEDNSAAFSNKFGHSAILRERTFPVLVEFVPTTLAPETVGEIGRVEAANPNFKGAIAKMRWIKPEDRRKEGQRTAHLMLSVRSETKANEIIRAGIIMEGRRTWGRRVFKDVTRCLKCQKFANHFAAGCPEKDDICGTCSLKHKTKECPNAGKPENYACANCEKAGHAAWSRECPVFIRRNESLKDKYPESRYRFYLTDDPSTWEMGGGEQTDHVPPNHRRAPRTALEGNATPHGNTPDNARGGKRPGEAQPPGRQSQLSNYGFTAASQRTRWDDRLNAGEDNDDLYG